MAILNMASSCIFQREADRGFAPYIIDFEFYLWY